VSAIIPPLSSPAGLTRGQIACGSHEATKGAAFGAGRGSRRDRRGKERRREGKSPSRSPPALGAGQVSGLGVGAQAAKAAFSPPHGEGPGVGANPPPHGEGLGVGVRRSCVAPPCRWQTASPADRPQSGGITGRAKRAGPRQG
jgi:hypothetical protein